MITNHSAFSTKEITCILINTFFYRYFLQLLIISSCEQRFSLSCYWRSVTRNDRSWLTFIENIILQTTKAFLNYKMMQEIVPERMKLEWFKLRILERILRNVFCFRKTSTNKWDHLQTTALADVFSIQFLNFQRSRISTGNFEIKPA